MKIKEQYAQEMQWEEEFQAVFPRYVWDALGIALNAERLVVLRGKALRGTFCIQNTEDVYIVGRIYYCPGLKKAVLKYTPSGDARMKYEFFPESQARNIAHLNKFVYEAANAASLHRGRIRQEFYERVRSWVESDLPAEARNGYQWAILGSDLSWRERLDLLRRYYEKHGEGE